MTFDIWVVEGAGVASLNVHDVEVLAPFLVAFSRSVVPSRLVPSVPLWVWFHWRA